MNLVQNRIFCVALNLIRDNYGSPTIFGETEVNIPHRFIIEQGWNWSDVKKAVLQLQSLAWTHDSFDGAGFISLFGEGMAVRNQGIVLAFRAKALEFIMNGNQFVEYNLETFLNFKSSYSQRLYRILSLKKEIGWDPSLEEFKDKMCISKGYTYGHISERVLKVAKNELSRFSDIDFTYEVIKKGRKVIGLKFKVVENLLSHILHQSTDEKSKNCLRILREKGFSEKDQAIILKSHVKEFLKLNNHCQQEKIPNPNGYILKCLNLI